MSSGHGKRQVQIEVVQQQTGRAPVEPTGPTHRPVVEETAARRPMVVLSSATIDCVILAMSMA